MILTILLSAQVAAAAAPAPATAPPSTRHWNRMFISPMGEPFRQTTRNDDALADWFTQADKNHDGKLTLEEMQADAERFFATLDVSHDGEIDPEDITRYENVVAPEVTTGSSYGMMPGGKGSGHKAGFIRGFDDQHQGAGRFGLLDLPEPVVSADSNFNRGVSVAEFRQAAATRFMALDLDHHGYLTLPLLESIRPAPPAAPKQPERRSDPDESALPDQNGPG